MGLSLLLGLMSATVPRLILVDSHGLEAVAVFSALAYVVLAGPLTVATTSGAVLARMASMHAAGDLAGFRRIARHLLLLAGGLGSVGTAVAVVWGEPLIVLIYGSAYAGHGGALVLLCLAGTTAMIGSAQGSVMTAAHMHAAQLSSTAASLCVLTALAWMLTPSWGLIGAATAAAVGSLLLIVLRVRPVSNAMYGVQP
jgi:O-antigen/teichoic acid export membrane protein